MNYSVAYDEVKLLCKTIEASAPDKDYINAYMVGAFRALLADILADNPDTLSIVHRHRAAFEGYR